MMRSTINQLLLPLALGAASCGIDTDPELLDPPLESGRLPLDDSALADETAPSTTMAGCSPEGGLWCGQNGIGGEPNFLYECDDGVLVVREVCANGCVNAPPGVPDSCNQPNGADLDCTCASGSYHNGDSIPPSLTYCGMRVCGEDGQVYECTTANAWEGTGLGCGQGDCSCPNGAHLDTTPIDSAQTECHFQVCGGGNQWYTCGSGGWEGVAGSYCTMGGEVGPGPVDDPNSCVGHCGGSAGNCWCDDQCAGYGDCCADKASVCDGGGGITCGDLVAQQGWDWGDCEWNGNGACGGVGTPTSDCDYCCGGGSDNDGFGYPVGDLTTYPAGGWSLWQPIGNYWSAYGGRHLAHDISNGGAPSIDAPVYSVADGVVRYAGPNTSQYRNVVLIEHDDGQGGTICSFYGHIHDLTVSTGQPVGRGDQIAQVLDWAVCAPGGSSTNTHLHYVLLNEGLCDASANAGGTLVCAYDGAVTDLTPEPFSYQPVNDSCGAWQHGQAYISPSQFIDANHF